MTRGPDHDELNRLDREARARLRGRVRAEVVRRGLASVMNRTRWEELRDAMARLPFTPPYQVQSILGPREDLWPDDRLTSQGCWCAECLEPFWTIEWMRILPGLWRQEGALLSPRQVGDVADALRAELTRLHLPFCEDARGFWIQGYSAGDPTLGPPEFGA